MISCKERDKESNSVIKFNNYSFFGSQAGGKKSLPFTDSVYILSNKNGQAGELWSGLW